MTDEALQESGVVSDTEALYLTREESRAVLDRKLNALDEINAKAMHTVRTAVVFLGVVVSAIALLGRSGRTLAGTASTLAIAASVICLLVAIGTGIVTYSTSGVPDGVSRSYRDDVREGGYDEVNWLLVLLGGYDRWVEGVSRTKQRKERLLSRAQFLLAIGLLAATASVILYVAGS